MARFHLGLSDEQFFALTPRQFHLLLARHRERSEHQEYLSALVASTVANFSFSAPKKMLLPSDFMATRAKAVVKQKAAPRQLVAQNIRCFLKGQIAAQQG